jgi:transglutaminase-like putative cysteine protease
MRLRQGSAVSSALAALATLTAAWPITTLLQEPTWLKGTVLLLAVIAVSGFGARSLALRGWQVLLVQLACSVLAAGAIYAPGRLWHGLPTFETLGFAGRLIRESVTTAQKFAAPAPSTPGLIFVVGCSLGLVALCVDYLAVTRRSPSLAGLPLLTVFLAVAANRGSTLPVLYFLAAASMWLVLVARTDGRVQRRWGTTVPLAHTPAPQSPPSQGVYEHASTARMLGAAALVAAVAMPVVLPHTPPTFLASGLGRSSSANGNSSVGVGISQSVDLAADLRSPRREPVLEYTTADVSPPPLRVTVGASYRPEQGLWLPWGRPWRSSSGQPDMSANPKVPEPTGLSPEVPRKTFVMSVRKNLLDDPFLAVPYPLVGADLAGIRWGSDYETQSVRIAQRPDAYAVSYWQVEPTATMLRNTLPLSDRDRYLFQLDLRLDGPYVARVSALTERLTAGKSSAYDKAMSIQQYLRADGGFKYSLTLAPPARDRSGKVADYDALTNFLITKKGYCVQFATAMVMMSRAAGIPARMAIGFLPGTQSKGVWTVLTADAHAWPELYLDGIGWTRFEPTPNDRATPPAYAIPGTSPGAAINSGPKSPAAAQAAKNKNRADLGTPTPGSEASQQAGRGPLSLVRWLAHGWGLVLFGFLVALTGTMVVPAAAQWRRRRSLANAHSAAESVEVEWDHLTASLGDLGITPDPSRTPRQQHTYYEREALLEGADSQALARVVQTLERSRYAVSSPEREQVITADARQVLRASAANRAGRYRLRAVLWPSSGITQLRSVGAHLRSMIQTPLVRMSGLIHRTRRPVDATEASVSLKHD